MEFPGYSEDTIEELKKMGKLKYNSITGRYNGKTPFAYKVAFWLNLRNYEMVIAKIAEQDAPSQPNLN